MMVDRQTCDDDEGLRNVIRLEKVSDENISDLDIQHVVRGGPFRGVIVRPPLNGNTRFRILLNSSIVSELFHGYVRSPRCEVWK